MDNFSQGPVSARAQIIAVLGSITLFLIITWLIKKRYLRSGYSILWFLVSGTLLILSLFVNLLYLLAVTIGIEYAPAAFFAVVLVGLILISIHFSTVISKHERRIKKLAQEIALLKEKLGNKS